MMLPCGFEICGEMLATQTDSFYLCFREAKHKGGHNGSLITVPWEDPKQAGWYTRGGKNIAA